VIAGGTPMADATAFGQWNAARRLLERGARTTFWEASALGLLDRVEAHFEADSSPSGEDATEGLWGACHGGHLDLAKYILDHGADMKSTGHPHSH
jgi:ankyrin repeat protein